MKEVKVNNMLVKNEEDTTASEPWIFDRPYIFMSTLKSGVKSLSDIAETFGISSQNMRPWLLMLAKEGLVEQPKVGLYKLSDAGRNIFDMPYKVNKLNERCDSLEEELRKNSEIINHLRNSLEKFL
jgi:predicted transcriptional regulator